MIGGHEVIEVAHGEQALGEGIGSAHVWLVCLVGSVASIVLARRQPGSDGGEYFSSLLRPSVVLLDISMPERDGYQLCSDLKGCIETRDAAVIFITSNDGFEQELKAFEVGAADFVPKPFNPQLVKARVQVQLALRREQRRLLSTQRDLDHVVKNVPGHITFWNSDLLCQLCNDQGGKWFNVPPDGFLGKTMEEVLGEHVAKAIGPSLSQLMLNAGHDGSLTTEHLTLHCQSDHQVALARCLIDRRG